MPSIRNLSSKNEDGSFPGDPTEELGQRLSPSERATRVLQEIEGVSAAYGISNWEKNFLLDNQVSTWPAFTPKQEAAMKRIEAKVFNEQKDGPDDDLLNDALKDAELEEGETGMTGQLRFKK